MCVGVVLLWCLCVGVVRCMCVAVVCNKMRCDVCVRLCGWMLRAFMRWDVCVGLCGGIVMFVYTLRCVCVCVR